MKLKLLAFGIAKEILKNQQIYIELSLDEGTVHDLRHQLEVRYPEIKKLASYMVAINRAYANDTDQINENDEIAIIPPVSGG